MPAPIADRVEAVLASLLDPAEVAVAAAAVEERLGDGRAPVAALTAAVEELRRRLRVTDDVLVTVLADEGGAEPELVTVVLDLDPGRVREVLDDYAGGTAGPADDRTDDAADDPVEATAVALPPSEPEPTDEAASRPGDESPPVGPHPPPAEPRASRRLVFIDDALAEPHAPPAAPETPAGPSSRRRSVLVAVAVLAVAAVVVAVVLGLGATPVDVAP